MKKETAKIFAYSCAFYGILSPVATLMDKHPVNSPQFIVNNIIAVILLLWFPLFMIVYAVLPEEKKEQKTNEKE